MAEFTESFVCVVSTPDGEDRRGIVAVDPNNVTISIEDNDGEWVCQVGVASIMDWVCQVGVADIMDRVGVSSGCG